MRMKKRRKSILKPFQSVFGGSDDEDDEEKNDEDAKTTEDDDDDKADEDEEEEDDKADEKDDEKEAKPPQIKFDAKEFEKDWHTEWKHGDFPSYKETYSIRYIPWPRCDCGSRGCA